MIKMDSKRKYDIVIFGATSFTAKFVIVEVLKVLDNGEKLRWAVAARSADKMDKVLQEIGEETGKDLSKVAKIQAEASDDAALAAMAQECQVVVNCVGPYIQFGEGVVKACAEAGTHHVDLAGEPLYHLKMEEKYTKTAEETGAYIVGACGFDSLVPDLGAIYLQQQFDGEVNSVECFVHLGSDDAKLPIGYATYHSGILTMHSIRQLLALGRQFNRDANLPKPTHKLNNKMLQYRAEVSAWCMYSPIPDEYMLHRTQRHALRTDTGKPFQSNVNMVVPGFMTACAMSFGFGFILMLSQFKWGVRLLEKHPKFFTFGLVGHGEPTQEEMDKSNFTVTLVAKGWETGAKQDTPPNKTKVLKISGKNPGYGAAVRMLLYSALTMISERDKMPSKGGVYSPGTAFAKTTLIDRLARNGVSFAFDKN